MSHRAPAETAPARKRAHGLVIRLERESWFDRHPALALCLSMIFSENRYPLFRIMLLAGVVMLSLFGLAVGRLIDWLEAGLLLWR